MGVTTYLRLCSPVWQTATSGRKLPLRLLPGHFRILLLLQEPDWPIKCKLRGAVMEPSTPASLRSLGVELIPAPPPPGVEEWVFCVYCLDQGWGHFQRLPPVMSQLFLPHRLKTQSQIASFVSPNYNLGSGDMTIAGQGPSVPTVSQSLATTTWKTTWLYIYPPQEGAAVKLGILRCQHKLLTYV